LLHQKIDHYSEVVRSKRESFQFGNTFFVATRGREANRLGAPVLGRLRLIALDFIGGYTSCPHEGHVEFFSFDEAYLKRLRDRDFPTEQHFVTYFSRLLLIKLRSRLRSSQAVEDIRQETFVRVLKAVQAPGTIRSAEGLGSFVNSICNNILQEYYRSSARSVSSDDTPLDPPDESIDLDGMLVAKQTQEQVKLTLSKLSEKERRLLRAMFFEDKDKDEICQDFGVDRDYLRVLLHRAKQSFRTLYEQAGPPGPVGLGHSGHG